MAQSATQNQHAAPTLSDFARQGAVYDGLMNTLRQGSFVHAYLISGGAGLGKRTLAALMAQYLVCTGADKPCGRCAACVQAREGNHPDIILVRPGEPINPRVDRGLKSIPVDEIRQVNELAGRHTFEGGRRVVIIQSAHQMTPQAQNALLKTLEEPMPGTVFLLVTDAPELLLTTILAALKARGVAEGRARETRTLCGGSIGRAVSMAADEAYWQRRQEVMRDFFGLESRSEILRVSGVWKERRDAAAELLDDVEELIRALLLIRLGQREASAVSEYPEAWQRIAREGGISAVAALMDAVSQARRLRASQVTWQAVVEKLLLRLMEEKSKWSM